MKKILILLFSVALFVSCGSPKKAIEAGDYDKVVRDLALDLKKNPNNSKKAILLQEAFNKATARDLAAIKELKNTADQNPANWTKIYDIYDKMEIREIAVAPITPLYADGRELSLNIPNVTDEAESAKAEASKLLYKKATDLLATGDKLKAREAHAVLDQLVEFNFNYRDARELREQAKLKGSTNVFVKMKNSTGKQLPSSFESDLLTFRDGSFSDPWIQYSTKKVPGVEYSYEVDLDIQQVLIGRPNEQSRQYRETARVVVGYKEGRDSEGNAVRIPQYQDVYADILETMQVKPIRVTGNVIYKNYKTQEVLATIPVQREEAWKNIYAQFRGDQRALKQETVAKIKNGRKEFPSDEKFYEVSGKLLNQVVVKLFEENARNLQQ